MTPDELRALIRTVPNFPKAGIQFRDITTLISHGEGLRASVKHLAQLARDAGAEAIAGMEARGFIFGAAVAVELGVPTIGVEYDLEYGTDRLEIDPDAVRAGENIVIVDDLIATGGTALAAAQLLRQAGANVSHAHFIIDLPDLGGADKLRAAGVAVKALMQFAGE